MKLVWNLLALLMASAVLVAACGAPPAGSGSYTVGDEIYGMTIQEISGSWHLIHFDPTDPTSQDLWYNPDTKQYMRVATFADGELTLPRYAKAFKAELKLFGMNSTGVIKNTTFNGRPALIIPEVGVPVRYALQSGLLTIEHLESLIPAYIELHGSMYDAGVIVKDVGVFQSTYIAELDRLFIADVEKVVFKKEAMLYDFMRRQYMAGITDAINENFMYYKQRYGQNPQMTAIAPLPGNSQIIAAERAGTEVLVMSKVNGDSSRVFLTSEELSWLRSGDARILPVLESQGVVLPKTPFYEIAATKIGKTVLFLGDLYLIYTISDTIIDLGGAGETVSTSPSRSLDISGADTHQVEWLINNGFFPGPMFDTFSELTPQEVTDTQPLRMDMCYTVRLDNSNELNMGQPIGFSDDDIVTPIQICSGTDWVNYINIESGEYLFWQFVNGSWLGNGQSCLQYESVINNKNRNMSVLVPFSLCVTADAAIHEPRWVGKQ